MLRIFLSRMVHSTPATIQHKPSLFSPSSRPAQALRLSEEVEGLRARAAEAAALETALAAARAEIESARRGRDELLARADAQAAELRR